MADECVCLWFQAYEDLSRYFPGGSVPTGHMFGSSFTEVSIKTDSERRDSVSVRLTLDKRHRSSSVSV